MCMHVRVLMSVSLCELHRDRVFVLFAATSSAPSTVPGTKKEGWIVAAFACHVVVTFSESPIRNKP